MYCVYRVNPLEEPFRSMTISDLVNKKLCAPYTFESYPIMSRCVPTAMQNLERFLKGKFFKDNYNNSMNKSEETVENILQNIDVDKTCIEMQKLMNEIKPIAMVVEDIFQSKWVMVAGLIMGLLFSMFWIILLRFLAGIIVWVIIFLTIVVFAMLCFFSTYRYLSLIGYTTTVGGMNFTFSSEVKNYTMAPPTRYESYPEYYYNQKETWLILAIVTGIIFILLVILMIFLRKRIVLAVAVIKEASKAIGGIWSTLLWPLIPFVLILISMSFFLGIALWLASIQTKWIPQPNATSFWDNDSNSTKE